MLRKLLDALGFLRFVLRRWSEDRCPQIAGSLTYTTLLAIVPVFAIIVALLSSLPFFESVMVQIKIFLLLNLVPEIAGKIIRVYMQEFAQNAGRLTTLGVAVLFVTSLALLFTIDRSLNAIWRVRRSRPYWVAVLGYGTLLFAGPVLIGISVSITTYLMSLSAGIARVPERWQPLFTRPVSVAASTLAFFLLYRLVPHRPVAARHALAGALVAAVLFEGAKELFAVYVRHAPAYSIVYGAFAALPIFLIWLYLSWLVILFGAELTASLAYWRDGLWKRPPSPGTRFHEAVAVARHLLESGAPPVTFRRLQAATGIPAQELEDTLERMQDAGLLARHGRSGYAFARDPGRITLEELYTATVAPAAGLAPEAWEELSPAFVRAAGLIQAELRRPLTSLQSGKLRE